MTLYDIQFDNSYDMFLDGQDISFADETTIVQQRLASRLQFFLEEWFLDTTAGLPFIQFILKQSSDLKDIYSIIRSEILNTDGVEIIDSLEFTPISKDKVLLINFSVNQGAIQDTIEVTV